MDIVQTFYDNLASQYHKLFLDWESATREQAVILSKIFEDNGFDRSARVLDCACGIGTQSVGLALLGYDITASDISEKELAEAKIRAKKNNVEICFERANFCNLSETFSNKFDIVIAMDNALPHMLTKSKLENAVKSITNQIAMGGMFVASIRDYDALLEQKPPFSAPYIHKTDNGQRVSFQTWQWKGDNYKLVQYIIDDEETLQVAKFDCEY
ncbi:MAG: class I SAM-dependent methyltransferase, partial [Clostridia bacterium]|nr:class I SAM-dependent methyltransferase [Clostridia bacterium]